MMAFLDRLAVQRTVAIGVVATFFTTLILSAIFVPLFTDEISSQIPYGRWQMDGYVLSNNLAACGIDLHAKAAPAFSYPFLYIESFFHGWLATPGAIRTRHFIELVLFLVLLSVATNKVIENLSIHQNARFTLLFSLLGVGLFPVMMTYARPEIKFLSSFVALYLIFLYKNYINARPVRLFAASIFYIFIICMIFTYHVKTIFLIPVIAFIVWSSFNSISVRIMLFGFPFVIALWAAISWSGRIADCQDKDIMAFIAAHMIPLTKIFSDPIALFHILLERLLSFELISPIPYFSNILSGSTYASEWFYMGFNLYYSYTINSVASVIILTVVCIIVFALVKIIMNYRNIYAGSNSIILILMIISLFVISFMQGKKHYYESIYVYILVLICFYNSISYLQLSATNISRVAIAAGLLSTTGQLALYANYFPMLQTIIDGRVVYEKQHFSLSAFKYDRIKADVQAVAPMCGIDLSSRNRHLVIDDITYLSLVNQTYRPMHGLFIHYWWFDPAKRRDVAIASFQSSGKIVSCNHVFPEFKGREKRSGDICCVSAEDMLPR